VAEAVASGSQPRPGDKRPHPDGHGRSMCPVRHGCHEIPSRHATAAATVVRAARAPPVSPDRLRRPRATGSSGGQRISTEPQALHGRGRSRRTARCRRRVSTHPDDIPRFCIGRAESRQSPRHTMLRTHMRLGSHGRLKPHADGHVPVVCELPHRLRGHASILSPPPRCCGGIQVS